MKLRRRFLATFFCCSKSRCMAVTSMPPTVCCGWPFAGFSSSSESSSRFSFSEIISSKLGSNCIVLLSSSGDPLASQSATPGSGEATTLIMCTGVAEEEAAGAKSPKGVLGGPSSISTSRSLTGDPCGRLNCSLDFSRSSFRASSARCWRRFSCHASRSSAGGSASSSTLAWALITCCFHSSSSEPSEPSSRSSLRGFATAGWSLDFFPGDGLTVGGLFGTTFAGFSFLPSFSVLRFFSFATFRTFVSFATFVVLLVFTDLLSLLGGFPSGGGGSTLVPSARGLPLRGLVAGLSSRVLFSFMGLSTLGLLSLARGSTGFSSRIRGSRLRLSRPRFSRGASLPRLSLPRSSFTISRRGGPRLSARPSRTGARPLSRRGSGGAGDRARESRRWRLSRRTAGRSVRRPSRSPLERPHCSD
mmetsp:Transcript_23808/g.57733  ORF Transcript_23808/g.57733 Transcript_23808/m.57733 type:complete len:417 (+) Transcript_23808:1461-2711(+)